MTKKCGFCQVVWTTKSGTNRVDPKRVASQLCPDCATFDYPIYTKRKLEAEKSLAKPEKKERAAK
jgi:hypothetical protein